jgi:hypothetical protein
MKPQQNLTNEEVKGNFTNQFEMVICAIGFARDIIRERAASGNIDNQNSAVQALGRLSGKELP